MTVFSMRRRPKDRWISTSASFLIHLAFFLVGGTLFARGAEYGVEIGSGVEISLIAAPAAAVVNEPMTALDAEQPVLIQQPKPAEPVVPAQPAPQVISGDGSSPVPGQDKTTFHSSAGAVTEAKPRYLRNPAPVYPEEARRKGQEGLVTLSADVDASGRALEVRLKKSSGHPSLDDSALKTVRRWKFEPAKLGSLKVASRVEIPVRFQLKDAR